MSGTFNNDRSKSPLMADLYALAVKHDVVMVAVVTHPNGMTSALSIDRRDDTTPEQAGAAFWAAALHLSIATLNVRTAAVEAVAEAERVGADHV